MASPPPEASGLSSQQRLSERTSVASGEQRTQERRASAPLLEQHLRFEAALTGEGVINGRKEHGIFDVVRFPTNNAVELCTVLRDFTPYATYSEEPVISARHVFFSFIRYEDCSTAFHVIKRRNVLVLLGNTARRTVTRWQHRMWYNTL